MLHPDLDRLPRPSGAGGARPTAFLLVLALAWAHAPQAIEAQPADPGTPTRSIAVTFDDLPLTGGAERLGCNRQAVLALTDRLLAALAAHAVPAFGFVVESRVCPALQGDLLVEVLERWLRGGHGLGNHTFDHPDIDRVDFATYAASLVRGETTVRRLLAAQGEELRYFRPPYLHTGTTRAKKDALERLLEERGYRMGVVTVDSDEWLFARAYDRAADAGDEAAMARIAGAYVPWTQAVVRHFEARAVAVVGREIPQVLLLHANRLNAATFGSMATMLEGRGYRFVSLDQALADPAYRRADPYLGPRGLSWIHRWGTADGREPVMEPSAPEWITAYDP